MNIAGLFLILCALSAGERLPASAVQHTQVISPPIIDVQRRAIEYARIDPSEITSWKRRARMSALLPRFEVDYERKMRYYVDVRVNDSVYVGNDGVTVGPGEGQSQVNDDNNQNVAVKALWNFNEAIFNPDSLDVSMETRNLARERRSILAEVNANYYEREKLMGEIDFLEDEKGTSADKKKIEHDIFIKKVAFREATAALDALTGGWFGREAERLGGGR